MRLIYQQHMYFESVLTQATHYLQPFGETHLRCSWNVSDNHSWSWRLCVSTWPAAAAAAKSLQSCPTLCDPIDGSPPGSPVPGILQARTLEWVAISFSNSFLLFMKVKSESEVAQSCPTLSDPMDCSPPSSSIHGIFQARVPEWGAIAFSKWKLFIDHKANSAFTVYILKKPFY